MDEIFFKKQINEIVSEKSINANLIKNTSGYILIDTLVDINSYINRYMHNLGFELILDEHTNFAAGSRTITRSKI